MKITRALISVWDKTGVVDLARALAGKGVEIVSSGGTAAALRDAGIAVTDVSDVTGFPEMLDGRVKTLHPKIHAGILADRTNPGHLSTIESHGIGVIDLVVSNLYPFDEKVDATTPLDEAIELIDVGGPSMVRAAAKNHASVVVVVDPADYALVQSGETTPETRRRLAAKAFARLAAYDAKVASYLGADEVLTITAEKLSSLRYGENPHQQGAVYKLPGPRAGVVGGEQIQGKELSYCNYLDLDAAFGLATAFNEPAACIIKHTSPCGAATADTIEEAYRLAYECDTRAAFGGIIGVNRPFTAGIAQQMREAKLNVDCIVAPEYEPEARDILSSRRNCRVLRVPDAGRRAFDLRTISGGLLMQTPDAVAETRNQMQVVTKRAPSEAEWDDLLFAWVVCAYVRSNTIVLARMRQAVGVGAGQMSRVESFEIAINRAGDRAKGAVAASDALIPFEDNIEVAANAGVSAIIQTGGSVRDQHVIAAADAAGIGMVFTGFRHFRH
jgi:phosphoribosylaminoimidazolecarboxamide formyltransferase/IMP cyclohydrolase